MKIHERIKELEKKNEELKSYIKVSNTEYENDNIREHIRRNQCELKGLQEGMKLTAQEILDFLDKRLGDGKDALILIKELKEKYGEYISIRYRAEL